MRSIYRDMEDRLVANSVLDRDLGCWFWIGHRVPDGYGTINIYLRDLKKCVTYKAHRVAYEVFIGPIPPDMEVDHTCHCPPCINPNHMRLVSRSENAKGNSRKHAPKWRSHLGSLP